MIEIISAVLWIMNKGAMWRGFYLAAALCLVGCSMPDATDQLGGWKCLHAYDPAKSPGVTSDLDEYLRRDYKSISDDSEDFIKKLKESHGITDEWNPDKFLTVQNAKFYEDGTGCHAVMYLIDIKTRWTDRLYVYVLKYDKFNKRTKVTKRETSNPYRCLGPRIAPAMIQV